MVGIARTAYTLATHRQIPRGVARLHPRYGTPWIVISIFSVLAFGLVLPLDIELLAGMFAYGALIAFALAHLSVCVLRFKEPNRPRAYKVPLNVRIRGRELPMPAVIGAVLSIAAWVGTFLYHDEARLFGSAWMAFGLAAVRRLPLARGAVADAHGRGSGRAVVEGARPRVRADPGARSSARSWTTTS